LQYFQITNQKDSRATAKLTRNANLLTKFGVIFLPVTLMTSYFSVQIPDLTDNYTGTTYWASFGVVLGISLILLLFFGKLLASLSNALDHYSDQVWKRIKLKLMKKKQGPNAAVKSVTG
jgi:flagellar biosynthesis protein FliP